MTTTFVNLKSELTVVKEMFSIDGYKTYRTRLHCNCQKEFNRRDGVLITTNLGSEELIIVKVIRCKSCVKKGGQL
jgi:hypothetical protein